MKIAKPFFNEMIKHCDEEEATEETVAASDDLQY